MWSEIEIVNMAMAELAQAPVANLALDPANPNLRKLLSVQKAARELVLKAHDWNEAAQEVGFNDQLSLSGPSGDFGFVYGVPTDSLRVSRLRFAGGRGTGVVWRLGTHLDNSNVRRQVLYSQAQIASGRVIITLPWDMMSVHLARLCALKMAELACVTVTGSERRKQAIAQDYVIALSEATNVEAFECVDEDDANPFLSPFGGMRGQAL